MAMTAAQLLLQPFAALYRAGWWGRVQLYRTGLLKRAEFSVPVISIGNLSVGGTGKSPMVEYLLRSLPGEQMATLSRGYGRTTHGYRLAGPADTAATIGDEPFQFFRQFPDVAVAVGEERALAIPQLMMDKPDTTLILMDDSFQHLPVQPDLSILLTTFDRPFWHDYLLPAGRLREPRAAAARADILIVTKCPAGRSSEELRAVLPPDLPVRAVWFATQQYDTLEDAFTGQPVGWPDHAVVVAGIAHPETFVEAVTAHVSGQVSPMIWSDHHRFTGADIDRICAAFGNFATGSAAVITTRKDAGRLAPYRALMEQSGVQVYALPVRMQLLAEEQRLLERIRETIEAKKKNSTHEEDAGKAG